MDRNIIMRVGGTTSPTALGRMEQVSVNQADGYVEVNAAQLDLAHGCTIVADVVIDASADAVVEVVIDAVADGVTDGVADAAADAANTAADAAADAVGDGAADAAADAPADAAESGLSPKAVSRLKILGLMLGTTMIRIANQASNAANDAAAGHSGSGSGSGAPTAKEYWTALYNTMVHNYPCDLPATQSCPANVRASQEALVLSFAVTIAKRDPAAAKQAQAFEAAWPLSSNKALKSALSNISGTAGIPAMVQYLETYTDPGASGGALVIATAGVLSTVASFVYSD